MLPGSLPTPTHSFSKGDTTPSLVAQALFKRLELGGPLCPQQGAIDPTEHPGENKKKKTKEHQFEPSAALFQSRNKLFSNNKYKKK